MAESFVCNCNFQYAVRITKVAQTNLYIHQMKKQEDHHHQESNTSE